MRRKRLGVSAPVDCRLDACILRRDDRGELRADPPRLIAGSFGEVRQILSLPVSFSARLVLNQLNMPNMWYPALWEEVQDAPIATVSIYIAVRAAGSEAQAEGPIAGGTGAPAIPSGRRGGQGKKHPRSGRPHRLPLHGRI